MDLMREGAEKDVAAAREHKHLCAHIHTALATDSGLRLKAWLRSACFMDTPMDGREIESRAMTQRVNARRDLFIALEQLAKEGEEYVASG